MGLMEQVPMEQEQKEAQLDGWWNSMQLEAKEIVKEVFEQYVNRWSIVQLETERICKAGVEEENKWL